MTPGLTFVFPAYNEAAGLEHTVTVAIETGDELVKSGDIVSFDIVVVDDASTDATGSIADAIAAGEPRVCVVHHAHNRGLGGALRSGFAAARGDVVLYTDADLPFDLSELGTALRLMRQQRADIVAAYRHHRMGEGLRRSVYSYGYNSLVHVALGLRCRDVNFAAKVVSRRVLDEVELRSEGSFVDVELLSKAARQGFRIVQFGVDYFPRSRGSSTLSSPSVIVRMLREMSVIGPQIRAMGPMP